MGVDEILLIAADWQLRALVRAQLVEEGYEVMALPSLQIGLAHLVRCDGPPCLAIVDTRGAQVQAEQLTDLWRLSGEAPLILCGDAWSRGALTREGLPPAEVLLRPFRVGNLVDQVRRLLACSGDDTPSG
jgi:DNA-binding response OmpR family regulator